MLNAVNDPIPSDRPPLVRKKVVVVTLVLGALCFAFFKFWFMPVKILGDSMHPTYRDGTRHFINRMAYWSSESQRGDVIALRSLDGDIYIKRIIALPGETIESNRGQILIDGKPLQNAGIKGFLPWKVDAHRLRRDEYYVIGDNRMTSIFGVVKRDHVIGRIVL